MPPTVYAGEARANTAIEIGRYRPSQHQFGSTRRNRRQTALWHPNGYTGEVHQWLRDGGSRPPRRCEHTRDSHYFNALAHGTEPASEPGLEASTRGGFRLSPASRIAAPATEPFGISKGSNPMRTHQHTRLVLPTALAATALLIGVAVAPGEGFARGGGGGGSHGSVSSPGSMSSPGMARSTSPSMPSGLTPGVQMPAAHPPGAPAAPSNSPQNARRDDHGGDHHHHPPPPPPGGGTTGSTSGTTIIAPAAPTQGLPLPDVGPAAVAPEIPVTPDSTQTPVPPQVQTSGGTLSPSTGGGGETLAACMGLWDSSTHMSNGEWRATCVRTLNGMDIGGGVTDFASTNPNAQQGGRQSATTARVIRQRQRTNTLRSD